jgi:hypothetical protein
LGTSRLMTSIFPMNFQDLIRSVTARTRTCSHTPRQHAVDAISSPPQRQTYLLAESQKVGSRAALHTAYKIREVRRSTHNSPAAPLSSFPPRYHHGARASCFDNKHSVAIHQSTYPFLVAYSIFDLLPRLAVQNIPA